MRFKIHISNTIHTGHAPVYVFMYVCMSFSCSSTRDAYKKVTVINAHRQILFRTEIFM